MSKSKQKGPANRAEPEDDELVAHDDAAIGRALRGSLLVLLALAGVGGGIAWWVNRPQPKEQAKQTEYVPPSKREASAADLPVVKFTDVTAKAGIQFTHTCGAIGEKLLPETMGSGCAFFDYDNDGDQDLLLVNSTYWPWDKNAKAPAPTQALYRNDGKGNFEDVTKGSGLDFSCYGMGVAVGDYDDDGDQDVYLTAVGPSHLLRNDDGKFVDVTDSAGVAGEKDQWGSSCGWFDFNNDGKLDLFVCNYVRWSRDLDRELGSTLDGKTRAYGPPTSFEGAFCKLYLNQGKGQFTDHSAAAGLQVVGEFAPHKPVGKSLGVAFADLDSDGFTDVIVANDTVQNFCFHNEQGKAFKEIAKDAGLAFDNNGNARGAMGADVADFRNNRTRGVVIGNFAEEMMSLYVQQKEPLSFFDEAQASGIGPQSRRELKFGVFFFDYDLDGRLDVLAANGHLEQEIGRVKSEQTYKQPPQLFWNAGDQGETEFVMVPPENPGEEFSKPMVGRGNAFADIDGDGDLDVILTQCGGPPRLLRNDQSLGRHWARFVLKNKGSNRSAIGAKLQLHAGGAVQERMIGPTHGYMSQSELAATFGLGSAGKIEKLVIRWPDGKVQEIAGPGVDKLHVIERD